MVNQGDGTSSVQEQLRTRPDWEQHFVTEWMIRVILFANPNVTHEFEPPIRAAPKLPVDYDFLFAFFLQQAHRLEIWRDIFNTVIEERDAFRRAEGPKADQ